MKVRKFNNIYPYTLYVLIFDEVDNINDIFKRFMFFKPNDLEEENEYISREFEEYNVATTIAGCYPVMDRKSNELGVLCIIYHTHRFDTKTAAHESVHIADYYFERCGLNGESFTEGDESFAYLVGWAAGCLMTVMEDYLCCKERNMTMEK